MLYLFIFYFIFLVVFIAYSAAGIYHLWRFGFVGDLTRPMIVLYSIVATGIVVTSLILIVLSAQTANI